MDKFTLVVTCSLKAYDQLLKALGETYLEFSISKEFKIDNKGYIYFEFGDREVDVYTLPTIEYLYNKIQELKETGETVDIRKIKA